MKTFISIVVFVLLLDMFGFMLWAVSGQKPVDNFYAGAITTNIIRAF